MVTLLRMEMLNLGQAGGYFFQMLWFRLQVLKTRDERAARFKLEEVPIVAQQQ